MSKTLILSLVLCIAVGYGLAWLEDMPSEETLVEYLQTIYMAPIDIEKIEEPKSIGPQPSVLTSSGLVHGTMTDQGHSFFGIPYAEPPIGDLRFRPPQPFEHADAIHNKTFQDVLMCYQIGYFLNRNESCLILDIHVPPTVDLSNPQTTPPLPVLFSIHGGGFILGSGTWPVFDGRYLSEVTNTIVVDINYRLGPFGFLLFDDGENVIDGNQGFKDQQLALKWVQDNIAKFGGDKDKVTIFGESAGAQSVMLHLISNISDPLFHRAIMQSNTWPNRYSTRELALNDTDFVIRSLRCGVVDTQIERECCGRFQSDYECLMNADSQLLINAMMKFMARNILQLNLIYAAEPFRPYIDGVEFQKQPIDLFKEGKWQKHKPFISGTNEEELIVLKYALGFLIRNENIYRGLNDAIYQYIGENVGTSISDKYIDTYGPNITDWPWLFSQQMTDIFFGCSMRALARFASANTEDQVYWYHYHHYLDGPDCRARFGPLCGHSSHAFDLHFVYRTINHTGLVVDPEDIPVMDAFSTFWGGLARTGNPNGGIDTSLGNFPDWLPYKESWINGSPGPWLNMRITPQPHLESDYRKDMCDFLDTLGIYMDPTDNGEITPETTALSSTTQAVDASQGTDSSATDKINEETTTGAASICTFNRIISVLTILLHVLNRTLL